MPRLSKEDFEGWKTHPITRMVRQHLKHREGRIRQDWSQGRGWTPESQAVVTILSDIEDMSFEDISNFYDEEEPLIEHESFTVFEEEEDDRAG